ncbi:MAG: DNA/RNA nuclease SfsA [Candidatus Neomarinimicrobiota bacterium]
MKIDVPLITANFVERPNRFITIIDIDGKKHLSHLPDPGRLKELLQPGVTLLVKKENKGKSRKTTFTTVMVKKSGRWISLVSTLPNKFVNQALRRNGLPILQSYELVRSEVTVKNHRFDFLLSDNKDRKFFLEVKSVTFVENGIAKFPDAITLRGMKHAKALTDIVSKGGCAGILFVCQRPDAILFEPMWERDPKFSHALLNASQSGVKVWCITLNISPTEITFNKEIPVNLRIKESSVL